jgi:hypothetical protein
LEAAVARNIQVIKSRQSPSCERLSTDRKAHEKFRLTDDEDNPARLIPMYEIEVIVTTLTRTELKLTANWPLVWMQAPGSIEILRKLLPGETVPPLEESVTRSGEFPVKRVRRWNLQLGDRLIVRCFFTGESKSQSPRFGLDLSRKFKLSLPLAALGSHGRGESQIGKPWKNGLKKP